MFKETYPNTVAIEKLFIIRNSVVSSGLVKADTVNKDAFLRGLIYYGINLGHNAGMIKERIPQAFNRCDFEQSLDDVGFFKLAKTLYN